MPRGFSKEYHAILDLCDRNQYDAAAYRMHEYRDKLTVDEFKFIINRFVRDGQTVRTA